MDACKPPGQNHSAAFRDVSRVHQSTAVTLGKQESEEFPRLPEGIWEASLSLPFKMPCTLQTQKQQHSKPTPKPTCESLGARRVGRAGDQ